MFARAFATFLASLSLLAASVASASADDGAAALLAKHKAFVGWQGGDGTFKSWRLTGKNVVEIRRGSLYRRTYTDGTITSESGFTGRIFWTANINGNVERLYDDGFRLNLAQDLIEDERTTAFEGTMRPDATVDGATLKVVRVAPDQAFPIDLYIDPATGAYVQAVIDPDHLKYVYHIDGYLDAGGKKVAAAYHYGNGRRRVYDTIDVGTPVTDADLHPPASRQHWDFADNDTIPIQVIYMSNGVISIGNSVHFDATFNGHPGRFLLDSGASQILLNKPFADQLGLADYGTASYTGVAGNVMHATRGLVKTIAIGTSVLHDTIVSVTSGSNHDGIDGIIGFDALAGAIVDVDLDASHMTILDPAKYSPAIAKGAYAFDVDLSSGQPRIHATAGKFPFRPVIDTGNAYSVIISDALRAPGKLMVMDVEHATFQGVDGETDYIDCARVLGITVGPYRYEDAPACFGSTDIWGEDGGLLGFDFLRHFNWTFDYPDGKLVLTPNSQK